MDEHLDLKHSLPAHGNLWIARCVVSTSSWSALWISPTTVLVLFLLLTLSCASFLWNFNSARTISKIYSGIGACTVHLAAISNQGPLLLCAFPPLISCPSTNKPHPLQDESRQFAFLVLSFPVQALNFIFRFSLAVIFICFFVLFYCG